MSERQLHWSDFPKRKVLFIVPTQKKEGLLPVEDDLTEIVPPLDWQIEIRVDYENKTGLSTLYNKEIDAHRGYDWIVFIHDDIRIRDYSIYHRLEEANRRGYDVVGVAGSKGFDIPNPTVPTGWWSPVNARNGLAGFVGHGIDGQHVCMTSYGPAPQRVLVVDGLFIAVSRHAIEEGLRFNEKFSFNHYDMALCMDAYKKGLTVGVEPIYLEHNSPGGGFNSPEFLKSQQTFYETYFV
jgi:hypothetical protein